MRTPPEYFSSLDHMRSTIDRFAAIDRLKPAIDQFAAIDKFKPAIDQFAAVDRFKPAIDQFAAVDRFKPAIDQFAAVDKLKPAIEQLAVVDRFKPVIDHFAAIDKFKPAIDQLAVVDRLKPAIDQFSAIDKLKAAFEHVSAFDKLRPAIDQISSLRDNARRSIDASSMLADAATRLERQQQVWETISRSSNLLGSTDYELPPVSIDFPNIADRFEKAIKERGDRDRELVNQQSDLLVSIADAGKKQNEIMAEISKLQGLLVKEALENSRIQRVVLYFAALSAVLALIALFK